MEPRITRIIVSVTTSEKKLLSRLADYEGRLSLTATIRHILLDAARQRGLITTENEPPRNPEEH